MSGISSAFPLSEVVLGHFVAFLANKNLSPVTICVYLYALCFTQIASGLLDPSLTSFVYLDYVLRGIGGHYLNARGPSASQLSRIYLGVVQGLVLPTNALQSEYVVGSMLRVFLASCTLGSLQAPHQL